MALPRTFAELAPETGSGAVHPLISIPAAARMLGFSEMTIRRAVKTKRFPAVQIGTKALVPRAFVEQLLNAAATGQTVVVEDLVRDTGRLPRQGGAE